MDFCRFLWFNKRYAFWHVTVGALFFALPPRFPVTPYIRPFGSLSLSGLFYTLLPCLLILLFAGMCKKKQYFILQKTILSGLGILSIRWGQICLMRILLSFVILYYVRPVRWIAWLNGALCIWTVDKRQEGRVPGLTKATKGIFEGTKNADEYILFRRCRFW